ncbi:DinB family protein [Ktedonobacter sp. SOSP1-85]|uniref:DinB family protein n=1 Tax=Ktedonobacter sp. SOSP1-85 TaxID=2778367 RepID=UPI0019157B44
MPTRAEIRDALRRSHEQLFTHFRALTPEELECPCTENEFPGGLPWRPKDHLAHLAFIERQFQGMIRRTIEGDPDPLGFNTRIGTTKRDEVLAWVHRQNQAYAKEHADDSLEEIFADLSATRQQSLELLEQLTDEQLAQPVPGAPWADGTIGGVLITNATHATIHTSWTEEGLHRQAEQGTRGLNRGSVSR